MQKKSAHKLFTPHRRSALRAAFWKGILVRTSRKWFKRISMHTRWIATSETSTKPVDIEIKLVTYAAGRIYHLRSAHIPPKREAGGFPAHWQVIMETRCISAWVWGLVDFFGSVELVDYSWYVIIKILWRFQRLPVLVHLTVLAVCNIVVVKWTTFTT